jgi:hypothetical protein
VRIFPGAGLTLVPGASEKAIRRETRSPGEWLSVHCADPRPDFSRFTGGFAALQPGAGSGRIDKTVLPVRINTERDLQGKEEPLVGQINAAQFFNLPDSVAYGISMAEKRLGGTALVEAGLGVFMQRVKQIGIFLRIVFQKSAKRRMTALFQQRFVFHLIQKQEERIVHEIEVRLVIRDALGKGERGLGLLVVLGEQGDVRKAVADPGENMVFFDDGPNASNTSGGTFPLMSVETSATRVFFQGKQGWFLIACMTSDCSTCSRKFRSSGTTSAEPTRAYSSETSDTRFSSSASLPPASRRR